MLQDVILIHTTIFSGHPGDVRSSDLESFGKNSRSGMFSKQNRTLCPPPPPRPLESDAFSLQGATGTECPSHTHLTVQPPLSLAGLKPSLRGTPAAAGAMHLLIHHRGTNDDLSSISTELPPHHPGLPRIGAASLQLQDKPLQGSISYFQ